MFGLLIFFDLTQLIKRLPSVYFPTPEMVQDLLQGFVHKDFIKDCDFSSLEKCNSSFVSDEWQQRESDVIWRLKGERQVLLKLIERRFSNVPTWALDKINAADADLLETWALRLFDVDSIEDLLA